MLPRSRLACRFAHSEADSAGDSWKKIDHRLVALKLHGLADEMREKIGRSERHIRFENRLNANTGAAPDQILEMKEQGADEWAQKAYEIYCDGPVFPGSPAYPLDALTCPPLRP